MLKTHKMYEIVGGWLDAEQALALADAIYEAEGYGWLPYPENKPEELGLYEVTILEGNKRVENDTWDGHGWTWRGVIAYRKPRPYEGEVTK
jgi:hypothetical protein